MSEKWNKRWPDIEQPWPVEGTLNPDVIKNNAGACVHE